MSGRQLVKVVLTGSIAGMPLTIAFLGTEFGRQCVVPYLREVIAATSTAPAEIAGADIAVVESDKTEVWRRPKPASVVLPLHVHMVTALPDDPGKLDELFPRKERARVRQQIRRHGYTYRVTNDASDFLWFYEHMYAPTMRARHGGNARSVSADDALSRVFRSGNLLLVYSNGTPVGGTANVLDRERNQVFGRLVGVLDGDVRHFRAGVPKAIGRFLLEWACRAGYSSVDFQGCEPFLRNGTFQAKVLLGAAVTHAPGLASFRLRLAGLRDSAAVREFFVQNPVIGCDPDDRLGTIRFDNGDGPVETVHVRRGVSFSQTIQLDAFLAGVTEGERTA